MSHNIFLLQLDKNGIYDLPNRFLDKLYRNAFFHISKYRFGRTKSEASKFLHKCESSLQSIINCRNLTIYIDLYGLQHSRRNLDPLVNCKSQFCHPALKNVVVQEITSYVILLTFLFHDFFHDFFTTVVCETAVVRIISESKYFIKLAHHLF